MGMGNGNGNGNAMDNTNSFVDKPKLNLKAKVVYRNRQKQTVQECEYALEDYMDMMSMDMKRLITDVEDLVYMSNNNSPKEEWPEWQLVSFNKIKTKLLDKAGEMERLPDSIFDANEESEDAPSVFWDKLFGGDRKGK